MIELYYYEISLLLIIYTKQISEVLPKKITMAEYYKLVGKESSEDGEENSSQASNTSSSSVASDSEAIVV